ncbi:hypothetical protein WJX82_006364 [Trebouxia sp. C0006]
MLTADGALCFQLISCSPSVLKTAASGRNCGVQTVGSNILEELPLEALDMVLCLLDPLRFSIFMQPLVQACQQLPSDLPP